MARKEGLNDTDGHTCTITGIQALKRQLAREMQHKNRACGYKAAVCPECYESVHVRSRRCPHCTSVIHPIRPEFPVDE